MTMRGPVAWRCAWLAVAAAIPLRLYFFAGYGLGDDYIFVQTPLRVLETGTLDFEDFRTNRLLLVLIQVTTFLLLPVDDFSFVLPIFVFAIGAHALSVHFARALLGERAALVVSLLWLTSPYESLASTAFCLDYLLTFFSLACACCCWRGVRDGRAAAMVGGGLLLVCCFLTKASAILLVPVLGMATVLARHRWSRWIVFWSAFAWGMAAVSLGFWLAAGDPLQWLVERAYPAWGHDVTDRLGEVLGKYPRYLLWTDPDHGGWMFGVTGALGLAGLLWATGVWISERDRASGVLVLLLAYVALFNFVPHKLDLTAYYSHPRIFRYLAQIVPCIYLGGAYAIERLWRGGRAGRVAAVGCLVAASVFGLQQTPGVTAPSRGPGEDGRALSAFFRERVAASDVAIRSDKWSCDRLRYMNYPESRRWQFDCRDFIDAAEKLAFLQAIDHGYVVTGGGALDWYSHHPWVLNLAALGFEAPDAWELLLERPAPVTPWRTEPLRIWRVASELDDRSVVIADPAFASCLRARVSPLRPEDGLAPEQPITLRRARFVDRIECTDAGIEDASGVEHFVNATVLNLAGNSLTRIDVGALTNLEILILGVNALEDVTGIPRLRRLRLLWLGRNRLEAVDVRGLHQLRDLRLDGNRLTRLAGAEDLGKLETLFLGGNPALACASLPFPEGLLAASGCGP
jgi:hypothetical protein